MSLQTHPLVLLNQYLCNLLATKHNKLEESMRLTKPILDSKTLDGSANAIKVPAGKAT